MLNKSIIGKYLNIVRICYFTVLILRAVEFLLIVVKFNKQTGLFKNEAIGLINDFTLANIILTCLYPIYFLLCKWRAKYANTILISFIMIFVVFHILILRYFLHQLIPLDIFLLKYSVKEILHTIKSADVSISKIFILLFFIIAGILLFTHFNRKLKMPLIFNKLMLAITILSLPFGFLQIYNSYKPVDKFKVNKSVYFYSQILKNSTKSKYTNQYKSTDAVKFQKLYPDKKFIRTDYPLLYKTDSLNLLEEYFNKFDTVPNIVIVIVEGLNNDFLDNHNGIKLMPFLSQLKNESLYWNKCFSLGERSFAAIPSILGGLPHGEIGFTQLELLPRHLSLVSILESKGYHASFFYGSGSWFHQKDRFFRHNNIDLIYDKSKFPERFKKSIEDGGNPYCGYNDKIVFKHSLDVIDTIPNSKRLDIYFTTTSHPPFIVHENHKYEKKFKHLTEKMIENESSIQFETYKKQFKSILFVDDALNDFFREYKKRPEYQNTIFIITGDHPMTEIPIKNSLKRFHVPLIIHSEKLKKHKTFSNIVSHLDISETLITFLQQYIVGLPDLSSSLGNHLFKMSNKHIAFMNDNREIIDYYSNGYYLSAGKLHKVQDNLDLLTCNDSVIFETMKKELAVIKKTNDYVSLNDKIIPKEIYCKSIGKEVLYNVNNADNEVSFTSEYNDITPKLSVPNTSFSLDIRFTYQTESDGLSLVVHVVDDSAKAIFWKEYGIDKSKNEFQLKLNVPSLGTNNSHLILKSYFWNKDFSINSYKYFDILIYK